MDSTHSFPRCCVGTHKRLFDVILATLGFSLLLPLLILIALLIWLEDGRPILFTQQRIGKNQRPFRIYKFRSMCKGKVTRIGQWIRNTGLDEVWQFINVLNGSMSLVGPRPLTAEDVQRLDLHRDRRFEQRPGITGLSQLYAGKGLRVSCWLDEYDRQHASLWLDLKIIGLSALINLLGKQRVKAWLQRWRAHKRRQRQRAYQRLNKPPCDNLNDPKHKSEAK